ncbi:MAG: DUF935 family protein, partial [Comamonas sp.]
VSMGKDAAGIIPDGMSIEFMEAAGKGASADIYKIMMDWCERAKAKAILGGTLTSGTGEGTNTNALGNVHERGQLSLIRSDTRQYASTIRRDILWPMAAMNFGIEKVQRAPRFYLDTGETEDLKYLSETLPTFVDMGARIPAWWFHEKSGIPKAGKDEEVLRPKTALAPVGATRQPAMPVAALALSGEQDNSFKAFPDQQAIEDALDKLAAGDLDEQMLGILKPIMAQAEQGPEALRDTLDQLWPDLEDDQLQQRLAQVLFVGELWGMING